MSAGWLYRGAARAAASLLYSTGLLQAVEVRRSVATGEVSFPWSDIDLALTLDPAAVGDAEKLSALCRRVRTLGRLIPRLGHIEILEPGRLAVRAHEDTYWASLERRSNIPLAGRPELIPNLPVEPEHAVAKLCLWLEWFVVNALATRNRRNLRKTCLEAWMACAVAEGVLPEPFLRRDAMEEPAREHEAGLDPSRLGEPDYASRFAFGLAARLHAARHPTLGRLKRVLVFEATTPPLLLERRFVVLPEPRWPLPKEAFRLGAFPCTPESLDLYAHHLNPLIYESLPEELKDLGLQTPSPGAYARACRYYGHERFLYYPGFGGADSSTQEGRLEVLRRTVDALEAGQTPSKIPRDELQAMRTVQQTPERYYRERYPELRRRSLALADRVARL